MTEAPEGRSHYLFANVPRGKGAVRMTNDPPGAPGRELGLPAEAEWISFHAKKNEITNIFKGLLHGQGT